jgi:ribose-phosphate pyrophosphokinase
LPNYLQKIKNMLLFSTQAYQYLKNDIIKLGNYENGEIEVKKFPDGECYQRILTEVEGKDVAIIGGTPSDSDTLELYDLACAIEKYGAQSLTLVIPYFGYSTMERAVKHGEVVTAKMRARLFSSIPRTGSHNTVLLLDLHTEGLPHYFEGDVRAVHLYCKEIVLQTSQELAGGKDFIIACTDAGRAKWVESLANDLGINAAFVFKRRISGNETAVTSISADVLGKTVIIYDDMIRTGGSLISAAKAYKDAGAVRIFAITTHGLFSNNALERLQTSGLFEKVVSTNSHPNSVHLEKDFHNFLIVKSVANIVHQALVKQ